MADEVGGGIEITPEMVEAGCEVIWRSFGDVMPWGSDTAKGIAIEVYLAMRLCAEAKDGQNTER